MARYTDVVPGKYRGKLVDWIFTETNAGLPQICLCFRLEGVKNPQTGAEETADMLWYGSFRTEKAQEITMRTLIRLGLKSNNPTDIVDADGARIDGALDMTKTMELDVQSRADLKGNQKIGIMWVNEIGGGGLGQAEKLTAQTLKQKMAGLNLEGIGMALRQEMGKPAAVAPRPVANGAAAAGATTAQPMQQATFGEEDVPF